VLLGPEAVLPARGVSIAMAVRNTPDRACDHTMTCRLRRCQAPEWPEGHKSD